MKQEIKRVVSYRRVATEDQNVGTSPLDEQRERLAQLAASLGVPILLDFVEVESGAAEAEERRLQAARLVEAVGPGDVVAVVRFDRLARDPASATRTARRILDKGARFVSLEEGEFIDGPPPFGYRWANGRDPSDELRGLVVDPVAAPIVREVFDRSIRGRGADGVVRVEGSRRPDAANGGRARKG